MSVVLRCPSCQAKLRLDASPPMGTMIDCPKCGSAFPVRTTTSEEKTKAPDEVKKPSKKNKVVETKERVFMNEFALLGMVGGAMFALMLLLGITWVVLNRAAKVEDLVAVVPDGYPLIRGVYVQQLNKMPGYKTDMDSVYTKDMQDGFAVIAKGLGIDVTKSLSYVIMASGNSGTGTELYLFRTKDTFDRSKVDKIENIHTAKDSSGRTFYAFDAGNELPFLKGTVVECPTKNLVVVTRFDLDGKAAAEASALAVNKPSDGTQKKIGDVGRLAVKAHFWKIHRNIGPSKESFAALGATIGKDKEFNKLASSTSTAQVLAIWMTFGSNGLRCGIGIECESDKQAKEVMKSLQEGPLGKGDESEAPNNLRGNFSMVMMKKTWGEFLQSLSFNQQGKAAYIRTKFDTDENRRIAFGIFMPPQREPQPNQPPTFP